MVFDKYKNSKTGMRISLKILKQITEDNNKLKHPFKKHPRKPII